LVVVVDRNQFQANVRTEDLIPLDSLRKKLEAFGLETRQIDGHDYHALDEVFSALPFSPGKPNAIIANTVRGCGVPSIQERADRWFMNPSAEEVESLIEELYRGSNNGGSPHGL
jgi:transketolase